MFCKSCDTVIYVCLNVSNEHVQYCCHCSHLTRVKASRNNSIIKVQQQKWPLVTGHWQNECQKSLTTNKFSRNYLIISGTSNLPPSKDNKTRIANNCRLLNIFLQPSQMNLRTRKHRNMSNSSNCAPEKKTVLFVFAKFRDKFLNFSFSFDQKKTEQD